MTLDDVDFENDLIKDLRLSFSRVSEFDRTGPRSLIKRTKIEGDFLDFGNLVDDMSQPNFNISDNYYIFNGSKPTASLGKLCDRLIEIINSEELVDINKTNEESLVINTISELGLWKTTKDPIILFKKFTQEARAYVIAKTTVGKRTLVTSELVQSAEETTAILKTHKHSKDFFKKDLIYQQKINFIIGNFKFISLLDYIEIDHIAKTVRGVDLKTGSKNVDEFLSNFIKYRYYLQALIYQHALTHWLKENNFEDYQILPFKFLYCGRYQRLPYFLEVPKTWMEASTNGFETKLGYKYKGLNELLDDIEWHWRNDVFNMSRKTFESKGNLIIDDTILN